MKLYRVTLEYTAKRVVFIEASDCDEAEVGGVALSKSRKWKGGNR